MISSRWKTDQSSLQFEVEIPANTTAKIFIPAVNADAITENGKTLSSVTEINMIGKEGEFFVVETGSGKYRFSVARTGSAVKR